MIMKNSLGFLSILEVLKFNLRSFLKIKNKNLINFFN